MERRRGCDRLQSLPRHRDGRRVLSRVRACPPADVHGQREHRDRCRYTTTGMDGLPGCPAPAVNPEGQGNLHFAIAADPVNSHLVYVAGDAGPLYVGNDTAPVVAGKDWTPISDVNGTADGSLPHADNRSLVFDAGGSLIETGDGGIYTRSFPRSPSGVWTSLIGTSSLAVTEIHSIAYDTNTNTLIAGTQDNSVPAQTAQGSLVWTAVNSGDGGDVAVDDSSPTQEIRYFSSQNLLGFTAATYDLNNNPIGVPVPPKLQVLGTGNPLKTIYAVEPALPFVTTVVLDSQDPRRMVIGGALSVYDSSDDGNTLTSLGLGGTSFGGFGAHMVYGGVSPAGKNADLLWIGAGKNVYLPHFPKQRLHRRDGDLRDRRRRQHHLAGDRSLRLAPGLHY